MLPDWSLLSLKNDPQRICFDSSERMFHKTLQNSNRHFKGETVLHFYAHRIFAVGFVLICFLRIVRIPTFNSHNFLAEIKEESYQWTLPEDSAKTSQPWVLWVKVTPQSNWDRKQGVNSEGGFPPPPPPSPPPSFSFFLWVEIHQLP